MEKLNWQKEKPDYACVFFTKHKYKEEFEYNIWRFMWEYTEPLEDDDSETRHYYLAWINNEGDEWDDIEECNYDEYLVIEILPTMEEVHRDWIKSMSDR